MEKVYCHDCSLFHSISCFQSSCKADLGMKDTPYARVPIYRDCEILNKNNTCKYYKPKKKEE